MDEPQQPKKPIDEVIKDLYGPSDDLSADQPSNKPTEASSDSLPAKTPAINVTPGTAEESPVPAETLPDEPAKLATDIWPPVPPIIGVDNAQPPWVEPTPPSGSDESDVFLRQPTAETNYPKPPIFQTSAIEEPVAESQATVPFVGVEGIQASYSVPTRDFTSPLPPRPEPATVSSDTAGILPTAPLVPTAPAIKSKLLLILPFIAIIAIGLAAFLFVKSRRVATPTGPVNLTYWGLFEPNSVFQQVVADYEKANPKVKINYQQQSGLREYRERLAAALTKGGGPDIFRMHVSWVPMFADGLAVIPSSVYSINDFDRDYYPSASVALKTVKGLVGLPIYFDALALFYNEDLFRAAGQTPPTTWEDLIKAACTLTVRDQIGRIKTGGVALGTPANVDHWSDILGLMMLQNGADPAIPDACNDRGVCPGQDALTFFSSFVKNSSCRNAEGAFLGSSWSDLLPSSTYAFATGQVAMYFAPSWRVFDIKNLNPNLNFKVVPVPQLTAEVKDKVAWATYWIESVSGNSSNQAEAWKFLKYLSSKEVLEKLYLAQTNLGGPRLFGEPYPRTEMASMLADDPWVGSFISQAPYARSWYLSSYTADNGINDGIIKYYEDAVNKSISGQDLTDALKVVTQGVAQILSRYGVQPTSR